MSTIPEFDADRKSLPLFRFLTTYFPLAWVEMTKVSVVNNARYSPDREPADISWNRAKSRDQLGSAMRHIFDYAVDGKRTEPVAAAIARQTGIHETRVLAAAAWRICAALQEDAELAIGNKLAQEEKREAVEAPHEGNRLIPHAHLPTLSEIQEEQNELMSRLTADTAEAPKSTICLGGQHTIASPGTQPAPTVAEGAARFVYDELPTCPGHRLGRGICPGATRIDLNRTSLELRGYFEEDRK